MISEFHGPYRFLSNFWPAEVALDGVTYPNVETAYQAAKVDDPAVREQIRRMAPGQAKRFVRRFPLPSDWETRKVAVMEDLVRQKFTRHLALAQRLLATGDAELQEGNRWGDAFWGVDLRTGRGSNHLGRLLMKVRSELAGAGRAWAAALAARTRL